MSTTSIIIYAVVGVGLAGFLFILVRSFQAAVLPTIVFGTVVAAFFWGYRQDTLNEWVQAWRIKGESENSSKPADSTPSERPTGTPVPQPNGLQPPLRPPVNPAGSVSAPGQQPSLAQTIDSVRSGDIQPQQHEQRNLYFEKLSQQLKELRGEQPPQPPDAPPGAPPAPPPTDSNAVAPPPPSLEAAPEDVSEEVATEPDEEDISADDEEGE